MSLRSNIQKDLNELLETAQGVSSRLDEQENAIGGSLEYSGHIDQTSQSSLEILRAIRSRRYRLWLWLKQQGKKLFGVATEGSRVIRGNMTNTEGSSVIRSEKCYSDPTPRGCDPDMEEPLEILKHISLEIGHSLDRQSVLLETLSERTEGSEDRFQRGIASAKRIQNK